MKTLLAEASVFDNFLVAVLTCDENGNLISYNQAATSLFDEQPQKGSKLWLQTWPMYHSNGKLIEPEDCPMHRAVKERVPFRNEEIIIEHPASNYRNLLVFSNPVFNDLGEFEGATHALIDITEQKSSEAKQAILAAIIESSDDAIISKTLEGVITSWNKGAERLFGYLEQEAIGRHITMLIPEDRLDEETLIIDKVIKGEILDHFETMRLTKYGIEIPISLTISPIKDSRGKVIGASKIARNIARQKQSEARLQEYAESLEILNSFGKSIAENMDVRDILQKVTDATTQLTGAAFGAFFYNMINKHGEAYMLYTLSGAPREAFEKLGQPRNTAVFQPTFNGERIVRVDDITQDPLYGKNAPFGGMPEGHLPVISYMAIPVVSKSGQVIGGLLYGHPERAKFTREHERLVDGIASHAATALDNAKLYEEIQQLNSKKDEFIGLASHELKTPVTSLKGYLQIIEKNPGNLDKNRFFVTKALQQINKLSGLISDLLDVSKIETGKLPFEFKSFDLVELINEVVELMRYANASHQIATDFDVQQLTIFADRLRVEQVIINLINNAIRYSPKSNQVNISLQLTAGGKVKVGVQDFGIGISAEHRQNIFKRFYRVDDLAAHMSGLGIGLYISHEIITRHQGTFSVESELGKGSTFFFELPIEGNPASSVTH